MENTCTNPVAHLEVDMSVILLMGSKMYSGEPQEIIVRETVQNALDAHATIIKIDRSHTNPNTPDTLTIADDGDGIADYQKYMLTIGGSSKRGTDGMIGGYGIAKLAIYSADDWTIKSTGGTLTRDMLINAQPIDTETRASGTQVYCEFKNTRGEWMDRNIKEYLKLTKTKCEIIYNGETIRPYRTEEIDIQYNDAGDRTTVQRILANDCNRAGRMVIRLNGLPMFEEYIQAESDLYIYDVKTTANPFDDDYPITSNREGFNPTSPHADIVRKTIAEIGTMTRHAAECLKAAEDNIRMLPDGKTLLMGNMQKRDLKTYAFEFKTYKRYIAQIAAMMGESEEYKSFTFGLTDNDKIAGSNGGGTQFTLNPQTCRHDKATILMIAVHEYAHRTVDSHYEAYTQAEDSISRMVYTGLFDKTFRQ